MYIPLHAHSAEASIGDSILKIDEYIAKAKAMGLTHLCVTNHGSMADMYNFYYKCKKENIIPIIGCEVYVAEDMLEKDKTKKRDYEHLVLIAKNDIGLKNLLRIVSDASLFGMYFKPRTDLKQIEKYSEGIICLSACLGGAIPKMIIASIESEDINMDTIAEEVYKYKKIFGDDYYLEIQPGTNENQLYVNDYICELSEVTGVEIVVTNDIHYLDEGDHIAHNVHVCISRKMEVTDEILYPDTVYYLMDEDELRTYFESFNQDVINKAINNTVKIASSCSVSLETDKIHMPVFPVPHGHTETSYLLEIVFEKFSESINRFPDAYKYTDRILYEIDVLDKLGFSGYFLIVRDFVMYAKANNIPVGPGRGSICGSLVAYLTGITEVDPIKYNLMFERFLSVHRIGSVPDVDLDFSSDKRPLMFDAAIEKYGKDKCALVSTIGMRKAKAALRDVARVFGVSAEEADRASKLIPISHYDEEGIKATDLSISDSIKIVPELAEMNRTYPEWFSMAMKLEDLPRTSSIHAAGTLISPKPLIDFVPLRQKDEASSIYATSLSLADAEIAGAIKQDFLGLATLSVIDGTQINSGFTFDFSNDELYKEEEVWNLIGSKHTTTLFQIGSKTYKARMGRLKPTTIKELAACLALVRGPCISSGADKIYMDIVEGKQEIEYIHDFYDSATAETNGILLYQEQLMQVSVNFGFSLEDSFRLMKAVSKKKIDKIAEFEERFKFYAKERNVDDDTTCRIWQIIVDAGLYLFNESHKQKCGPIK